MKRIILAIAAITAIAACTKSEVTYEAPGEIGFNVVAGNITKAPATGTAMPEGLNMYVNAYVHADADPNTVGTQFPDAPDYINNGEFKYRKEVTGDGKTIKLWGGKEPYYWPNEKKLHFSGFSKSGNFSALTDSPTSETKPSASYNPSTDVLTITNYTPGESIGPGANDLMWFPSTKYVESEGYGKSTPFVPVEMYHTCSWLTFMVQGDATTGGSSSTYTITSLTINGIDLTANVTCTGQPKTSGTPVLGNTTLKHYVVWGEHTQNNQSYTVTTSGVGLKDTYSKVGQTETLEPKNIETGKTKTAGGQQDGNVVVIPQVPGTINIEWTYESSAGQPVNDSATGLSLKIDDENSPWEPGKHYIYTITIKANEILIAPTPVTWADQVGGSVTVE